MSSRYDRILSRQFLTSDDVRSAASRGDGHVAVPQNCTVTDEARELALKLSIRLDDAGSAPRASVAKPPASRGSDAQGAPAAGRPGLSDDIYRRVVDAVSSVLTDMGLTERAAVLSPVVVRRVVANLAANRS